METGKENSVLSDGFLAHLLVAVTGASYWRLLYFYFPRNTQIPAGGRKHADQPDHRPVRVHAALLAHARHC